MFMRPRWNKFSSWSLWQELSVTTLGCSLVYETPMATSLVLGLGFLMLVLSISGSLEEASNADIVTGGVHKNTNML